MQQINLYHKKLKKKALAFSFQHLSYATLSLIVLLIFIQASNEYTFYTTQSQLKDKSKLLTDKTQRLKLFQASLPKIKKDSSLQVRLQQLEKDLVNKQTVLTVLSDKKLGNTNGFTEHFEGLARQTIHGLWIKRIHFTQGGTVLDIQGSSSQPNLVPKYLQALSTESAFQGTELDSFIIQKDDKTNTSEFMFNNINSSKNKPVTELTQ